MMNIIKALTFLSGAALVNFFKLMILICQVVNRILTMLNNF